MSMPFAGKTFTFTNPDGSTFEVRGWGDQYYAVFETLDGYTVVKDPATGYYQYAVLSDDKNSLVPSGTRMWGLETLKTSGCGRKSASGRRLHARLLAARRPRCKESGGGRPGEGKKKP